MNKKIKIILVLAFLSGGIAVMMGAFGAHLWQEILKETGKSDTYKTAVLYQFIHSVMMIVAAILYHIRPSSKLRLSGILFLGGIILFSGSLYTIGLSGISKFGMITPFGGLCFIAGWLILVWDVIRWE